MTQYIDKNALVEKINNLFNMSKFQCNSLDEADEAIGFQNALILIENFIDTLEVKEVDLEKELSLEDYKSFFEKHPDLSDDWGFDEAWVFAKYFFELGLKTQKGE